MIPNYNGRALLEANLPSVTAALARAPLAATEIIVPDDGSTDDSRAFLRKRYPEIRVIDGERNVGFAGNVNRGLRTARHELVLVLNSDAELLGDYFTPQLAHFDRADTFGTAGRIVGTGAAEGVVQGAAKYPDRRFGAITVNKNYLPQPEDPSCVLESYYLSGANLLADREKLLALGGFQELFNPYYNEDVDLSLSAWRAGWRCYYVDASVCRHPNAATIGRQDAARVKRVSKRNKFALHYLHLDGAELRYYLTKLGVKATARRLIGDRAYVESYGDFLALRPTLDAAKDALAPLRRRSHRAIAKEVQEAADARRIRVFQ